MANTDIVPAAKRQVRSYHGAFSGELLIFSFGKDLKPWRPTSARRLGWLAGIFALLWVVSHVLGIAVPIWTLGWVAYYFGLPIGLSYVFAHAIIEGRRLHVILVAWVQHSVSGGLSPRRSQRPLSPTRISVSETYRAKPSVLSRRPGRILVSTKARGLRLPRVRRSLVLAPVALAVAAAAIVVLVASSGTAARSVATAAVPIPPVVANVVPAPAKPTPARRPFRRRGDRAPRRTRRYDPVRRTKPVVVPPIPRTAPAVVQRTAPAAPPVASSPPPVSSAPTSTPSACYPGELGC